MRITLNENDVLNALAAKVAQLASEKLKQTLVAYNVRGGDTVRVTVTMDANDVRYQLHDAWLEIERQRT